MQRTIPALLINKKWLYRLNVAEFFIVGMVKIYGKNYLA